MKITFKTKQDERQVFNADGTMPVVRGYYIPKITKSHCDMNEARSSKRFGGYANSDMFETMIRRAVREQYGDFIPLSEANIQESGFLDIIVLTIAA